MENFNNIGLSVDGYEDEFFLQELISQHLPGCPDPVQLLDQCAFCCGQNYNAHPQPVLRSAHQAQSQFPQRLDNHRTWAEVAGTTPVVYTSMHVDTPMTNVSNSQATFNYPLPQSNAYDLGQFDFAQAEQRPTYAEVAQYANRSRNDRRNGRSAQHLHPSHVPHSSGSRHSSSGETRTRRTQYQHSSDSTSRPDRHPNRSISQTPSPARYSSNLPQVQEGVPAEPIQSSQPRNVADLIQATTFGGHRVPLPSSYLNSDDNNQDEPLSPGSHSVASSSISRRSSRRTGPAMRDPSFPHHCIECRHTFPKLEDLKRHISRTHAHVADRPYRCNQPPCPWAFVNPKDLRRHQRTHNSSDQDRHVCPFDFCGKSYTRADNLTRHVNRDHVGDSAYSSMSRTGSDMGGSFGQSGGYLEGVFEG